MATWKEKGEVPDSDDDDSFESDNDITFKPASKEKSAGQASQLVGSGVYGHDEPRAQDDLGRNKEILLVKPDITGSDFESIALSNEEITMTPTPPPPRDFESPLLPPQAFRDPRTLWDGESDTAVPTPKATPAATAHRPSQALPKEDEISKSYVRLTSPIFNDIASLPGSPVVAERPRNGFEYKEALEGDEERLPQEFRRTANTARRRLRHRNPNQLNPYTVEQLKYRAAMKARGVAPMIIEEPDSQEHRHRRRNTSLSELDSQEQYSQGVNMSTQASQNMESESNSSSPVATRNENPVAHLRNDDAGSGTEDDEEFPDIDTLLLRRNALVRKYGSNRRKRTYSLKLMQSRSLKEASKGPRSRHDREDSDRIFDIPASPPATSSPIHALIQNHRNLGNGDEAPLVRKSSWENEIHPEFELPTPATSAIKPSSDPILIGSDSELSSDDPFATTQQDLEESQDSSSDESIQIRKIGKKIRGVLPASHLRLDQHLANAKEANRDRRESPSVSPVKQPFRRGVALPKIATTRINLFPTTSTNVPIFFDEEDEEDDDAPHSGFIEEHVTAASEFDTEQRQGLAEEDDRIDTMLPSRKRRWHSSHSGPGKKRRVANLGASDARQPRITDHLRRKTITSDRYERRQYDHNKPRKSRQRANGRHSIQPPRLSIIDVMDSAGKSSKDLPQFIRIAVRTARSQNGQGRQSPTKKFIRLATREDTFDAQSVLQDWKDGKIKPKLVSSAGNSPSQSSRTPLRSINSNSQTKLPSPVAQALPGRLEQLLERTGYVGRPRRVTISKSKQRSMNEFVAVQDENLQSSPRLHLTELDHGLKNKNLSRIVQQSRPAQLETSERNYSSRFPTTAFKTTKKTLDSLYKTARKRHIQQPTLQMSRFLADSDPVKQSTEISEGQQLVPDESIVLPKTARLRKRLPRRLDTGAVLFRQPSEPLILEYLVPAKQDLKSEAGKLIGLDKFGTKYPIHFDIVPLPNGVYFHESTFIGSGRLAERPYNMDIRQPMRFQIGEKDFQWGLWDENVSSELGLCFDWVLDQMGKCSVLPSSADPVQSLTLVLDYLQRHISWATFQDQADFLSRMIEVLRDFASHLTISSEVEGQQQWHTQCRIEVTSRFIVLTLHLLQFSREPNQPLFASQLEEILIDTSRRCVGMLLLEGLGEVRALYDKLQYLSFRETGIKPDSYVTEAWVILIRTLTASKIPRSGFWDLVNTQLLEQHNATADNAREMEKTWYSMFSLLPLCEFDDHGVIVQNARHQASFDNWNLPQNFLKRIFTLYSSNTRQSPSFNDYCRAILSRCHYLISYWGWWKCGGIIGTMFDFFAAQNLAHLRNEEVHKSPHFLEELDLVQQLDVQPEDRCFHILLKIVALGLKHMRQTGDKKGIRNLITRLLPNHSRQYPKEEKIHERELAALRNNHDLLCTLYWAAPADQRPPLSLIQDLVVPDCSHNAACSINLRAWKQLARFILQSSTSSDDFKPFITWQNDFFAKLLKQYRDEELNTRKQAEGPNGNAIPEALLQQQIKTNKASTLVILLGTMENMIDAMLAATNTTSLMAAFNIEILQEALRCSVTKVFVTEEQVASCIIRIVQTYIQKVDHLYPYETPSTVQAALNEDSQESLFAVMGNLDRHVLLSHLSRPVMPHLYRLVRHILTSLKQEDGHFDVETLITLWASFVSVATEDSHDQLPLSTFLPGGVNFVFSDRHQQTKENAYWPQFLAELLRWRSLDDLEAVQCDPILEWMQILVLPESFSPYTLHLSYRMIKREHPLINVTSVGEAVICDYENRGSRVSYQRAYELIQAIISRMDEHIQNHASQFLQGNSAATRNIQMRYSSHLKAIMDVMEQQLVSMVPKTGEHLEYFEFVQSIVLRIRSHGSNIRPLTAFFVNESEKYWHKSSDPRLYGAGITAYLQRLPAQPQKTSFELFHYLYGGFLGDLREHRWLQHMSCIKRALRDWDLMDFMLENYVPAILLAGFVMQYRGENIRTSWVLASIYLPPLAHRLKRLLEKGGIKAAAVFNYMITILKITVNGIITRHREWPDSIQGAHPQHKGIIAVTSQFWLAMAPYLRAYSTDYPEQRADFNSVDHAFNVFAQVASREFENYRKGHHIWHISHIDPFNLTLRPYVEEFKKLILENMMHRSMGWRDFRHMDSAMLHRNGYIKCPNKLPLGQLWGPTLATILRDGSDVYEAETACKVVGTRHAHGKEASEQSDSMGLRNHCEGETSWLAREDDGLH
ncbi:Mus7/MMS22 family-domain-containing protein [Bisporella sp. PMI_857]|nr:Mus7/MMS22 family-domain-containing protein [Bisporella sp. PMI_857]